MLEPNSTGDPPGPVVIDARSELLFFRSAARAEQYLEPIDVRNGEYEAAYAADGSRLCIEVAQASRRVLVGLTSNTVEEVRIRRCGGAPADREALFSLIVGFLNRTRLAKSVPRSIDLAALIQWAVRRIGPD